MITAQEIVGLGYFTPRLMPTGEWAAIGRYLFTYGLVVGIDERSYRTRFCYRLRQDAEMALEDWDGTGDPPGKWIKEKGEIERSNPAMFKGVPISTEV